MAYSELIKNFEKIRAYMREFYVYGFKSRNEYSAKSARSYDDERRRIESWLGDYMHFTQEPNGKKVFISVDSRTAKSNPLYRAWKAKSFTDGDITLHFVLFDILCDSNIKLTLSELIEKIDERLNMKMIFDESTIRKKLKEYTKEGIIDTEKIGRRVLYSRSNTIDISDITDVTDFFSEAAPCGVIGSFLQDKQEEHENIFSFKHHYITGAIDSDVLAELFDAISKKRNITADNINKRTKEINNHRLLPLKIYISAQNGRQYLIAYNLKENRICSYRIDYLANIVQCEENENFDSIRRKLESMDSHMWGVNYRRKTEHVEFTIKVGENEGYIADRLEREKRCGSVEKLDDNHYKFIAEVCDIQEMIPWIRTFIGRITKLNFSDRTLENKFKSDIKLMYEMYNLEWGDKR